MKRLIPLCAAALLAAGCATTPQPAATQVVSNGETWRYFPDQPYGRKVFVERVAPDGKVIAREQRLSEEYIARLELDHSRKEEVFALFGPPYETAVYPRMEREVWSWHMRRFGVIPVGLHVQMSPDGVVREVLLLDEQKDGERRDSK
jgi:hypothetical protein